MKRILIFLLLTALIFPAIKPRPTVGGGFFATFVNDTFTGESSGTNLTAHTGETGATWAKHDINNAGNFLFDASGRVYPTAANTAYYASGTGTADYEVQVDVVTIAKEAGRAFGICGRASTSANTFYWFRYDGTANWNLYKAVAGSFTQLGSSTAVTINDGSTYTMRLRMLGSTITASVAVNGGAFSNVCGSPVTDSAISSAGKAMIFGDEAGGLSVGYHYDNFSAYDVSAPGTQDIAPNNANIFWSPANWAVTSSNARTVNQGAYALFNVTVAGNESISVVLDVSRMNGLTASRLPILEWCIDDGVLSTAQLPNTGVTNHSITLAASPTNGSRRVQLWFKAIEQAGGGVTPDLWGNNPTLPVGAVDITKFVIGSTSSMAAPTLRPYRMLVFGDSISGGAVLISNGESAANNDARRTWHNYFGSQLNAEVGNVSFGGIGLVTQTVAGGVPGVATSYSSLYSGVSRSFTGIDYVFIMLGANDSSISTGDVQTLTSNIRTACGNATKIVWVIEYLSASQIKRSTITSALTPPPNSNTKLLDPTLTRGQLIFPGTASRFSNDAGVGGAHLNAEGQALWGSWIFKDFDDAFTVTNAGKRRSW